MNETGTILRGYFRIEGPFVRMDMHKEQSGSTRYIGTLQVDVEDWEEVQKSFTKTKWYDVTTLLN